MAPEASKQQAAPRTINVRKFAESRANEIESLHNVVAHRLESNFRSRRNKRRRTTAHDNQLSNRRYRKRQKDSQLIGENRTSKTLDKISRRARRRNELRNNPQSGFCTSGDGTKRLRTHVWHAKRFSMTKLWGFHLPLGLQGRCRGSRALLKWYKQGVVVHDASYHLAVQLEGPEDSLISILKMVLFPHPPERSTYMHHSILSGATYGSAVLHHAGDFSGLPISPVTYIWRALDNQKCGNVAQEHLANGSDQSSGQQNFEDTKFFRQLWVWIHASAFTDGYKALEYACQKEMSARGSSIRYFSLEGQLAKLEVMGSKAFQLLQKTVHPVSRLQEGSVPLEKHTETHSVDHKNILENEEKFSSHAILSFMVSDPRTCVEEIVTDVTQSAYPCRADEVLPIEGEEQFTPTRILEESVELPLSSQVDLEWRDLWDAHSEIKPPVEENVLCKEKHGKRMDFLYLSNQDSATSDAFGTIPQSSRSCPVMLLRNNSLKDQCLGWSIILPLSWVKVFWICLVTKGAHPIGLKEKHRIACEAGLPYFPMDFPDCKAYTSSMLAEAAASNLKANSQPPSIRPLRVPFPPPWNTIQFAYDEGSSLREDGQIPQGRDQAESNNSPDSSIGYPEAMKCAPDVGFLNGSIARTSRELCLFIESLGGPLLLFPHGEKRGSTSMKILRSKLDLGHNPMGHSKSSDKLCLLRVTLHAFKEGVFEEGAVVCGPRVTDISVWTLRSGSRDVGLQIPQSAVSSYFKEETSGKWSLQAPPKDPVARESHRYPIGFVTTGFTRGSKKPLAIAFCEATWLARLREEQWKETPVKQRKKKEIYVLVRNLRSSAYRLAVATIVLEQQDEDAEFI